jgi:hypothetical protein
MPQKPIKCDMDLFIFAESRTGFMWNFEVYHGKVFEWDSSVTEVVKHLLGALLSEGYTIYVECFTSLFCQASSWQELTLALWGQ